MNVFKKKSTNLFEHPDTAGRTKILNVVLPDFDISKYGEDFLKFKKLEELFVQSDFINTYLLPIEIGRLETLIKLSILNFKYKEFPEWIFDLKNIKSLMVRGTDIAKIPNQISQLTQLENLRIENCAIMDLPNSVSKLDNLKQLSLTDNSKLTRLDTNCLPKSLNILNLAASGITNEDLYRIEAQLPRLKINQFVE